MATPVMAQEPNEKEGTQSVSSDEEIPSMLFLEFLGEFETEDGKWTDPEDLEKMVLEVPEKKENEEQ